MPVAAPSAERIVPRAAFDTILIFPLPEVSERKNVRVQQLLEIDTRSLLKMAWRNHDLELWSNRSGSLIPASVYLYPMIALV